MKKANHMTTFIPWEPASLFFTHVLGKSSSPPVVYFEIYFTARRPSLNRLREAMWTIPSLPLNTCMAPAEPKECVCFISRVKPEPVPKYRRFRGVTPHPSRERDAGRVPPRPHPPQSCRHGQVGSRYRGVCESLTEWESIGVWRRPSSVGQQPVAQPDFCNGGGARHPEGP